MPPWVEPRFRGGAQASGVKPLAVQDVEPVTLDLTVLAPVARVAQLGDGGDVDRVVQLPVASSVQPVPAVLARLPTVIDGGPSSGRGPLQRDRRRPAPSA